MKKIIFIFSLLIISGPLLAQIGISGQVSDDITGETLPGATIYIEGTTTGTITDIDGAFSIEVNAESAVLVVSFVGYITKEIVVGSQRVINVALEEDVQTLKEVVVTALGIKREKNALGYAVQDVKGDEVARTNPENVISALQGKVAGAQIVSSSGQVGASSTIQIRGNKSFKGSNQPLFVVDGTPIMNGVSSARVNSTYTDFGNAAMDIDPSNIESISILKGASASALYGSRAANGVVLITTKKGAKRKGIGVEFSTSFAVDEVYILPNYQNEYGQGLKTSEYDYSLWLEDEENAGKSYQDFHNEMGFSWALDGSGGQMSADESWGSRLDAGLMVNQMHGDSMPWISQPKNVKDYYKLGISTINNIALSAGGENASGRLTIGYTSQKGTSPNTDQKKLNIGVNSNFKLTDRLSVDINTTYTNLQNDNLPQQGNSMRNPLVEFNSWFGRQVDTKYLEDHYEDIVMYDGQEMAFNWMLAWPQQHANPYWNAYKNTMSRDRHRVYGNAAITYNLFQGVDIMGRVGTDFFNEHRKFLYHKYSRDWTDMYENSTNGNFWEQYRLESETNLDLLLKVDKDLTDDLLLLATVGTAHRSAYDQFATTSGINLVVPDFFSTSNYEGEASIDFTKYKKVTNSVFGSANLGFKRYLFLDLTLRGDWSSTLPRENWNYWYPSANLGFIFTDAFGIESRVLSYGKLRGGYAVVGNDTDPYSLMPVFYPMGETTFGNINLFGVQATLPTYNLKPEMTNSIEIGGDFKFFMNRLGIDLTYYNALTKNQLLDVDVPTSSGFSVWMKNAGSILNKGVELQIYGSVIQSEKGFNWDAMLNWSTNKNKITELEGDMEELHITTMYGNYSEVSLMAFLDDEWGAIYGSNMEKNDAGVVLVDEDGVPIQTTDPEILGYVNPDWIGGLRNTFSFKGITLSALIDFRKGGDVFSWTKAVGQHAGILQSTVDDGIREDGMIVEAVYAEGTMLDLDGDGTAEDVSGLANQTRISASDYWRESRNWGELSIVDGSFIKLREIVISYNLPLSFITKIGLQNASVSVYGRNLALLYTHKSNDVHIDPEVSSGGTVSGSGMESYQLPPSRTIGIKLNVKF